MTKDNTRSVPDSPDRMGHDLNKPDETASQADPAQDACGRYDRSVPVYDFEALADGQRMVMIRLGSEVYTLRRTQGGKLLLNK